MKYNEIIFKKGDLPTNYFNSIDSRISFSIDIIETYRLYKKWSREELINAVNNTELVDFIYDNYEILHMYGQDFVMENIDRYLNGLELTI